MGSGRAGSDHRGDDWERSERKSFRVALAIALLPVPAALLVAWAVGDLPWRARPDRAAMKGAPADLGRPSPPTGHGHP